MPDPGWIQPISWQLPTPVPQPAPALKSACQRTGPQPPTLQLSPLSHLSCTWMRSLSPSPAWYAAASIPACCRLPATVSHSFLCSLKCNCSHPVCHDTYTPLPPTPAFRYASHCHTPFYAVWNVTIVTQTAMMHHLPPAAFRYVWHCVTLTLLSVQFKT